MANNTLPDEFKVWEPFDYEYYEHWEAEGQEFAGLFR